MKKHPLSLVCLLVIVLAACGRKDEPAEPAVARVDGEPITAEAFRLAYAFGHGHLRRGAQPRHDYLRFMIYEKLLADEGRRLRLDTTAAVRAARRTLREELLVERVFETKVLDRIVVTDDEVRTEVERAAVSFAFRFLPAFSAPDARRLYEAARTRGFDAVLAEARDALADVDVVPTDLQSPLVKAEDVDPFVLDAIRDLPLHTPSEPVERDGQWFVFEVTEIRRERLSDVDYARRAPTFRKILYNRKAMEQGTAFVAATMEPLQVVTKREGFEVLRAALWDWYRDETPAYDFLDAVARRHVDTPYTRALAAHYATPLVRFGGETWTIRDFLERFTPGRYVLRARDPEAFAARLADVVALVVRDEVLLRTARAERLDDDPGFREATAQWEDKWLFDAFRRHLTAARPASDDVLHAYYAAADARTAGAFVPCDRLDAAGRERLRARWEHERLRRYADSLFARRRVAIDTTMLDTLQVDASTKNPYMTVHLFKSNSGKMPFPIVDPAWWAGGGGAPPSDQTSQPANPSER